MKVTVTDLDLTKLELSEEQSRALLWLAGLLEGEGSFGAWHRHKTEGRNPKCVMFGITLNMCDKDVVLKASNVVSYLLGGPPRSVYSRTRQGNRKLQWKVEWNGKHAQLLASLLLPYMGERRTEQIRNGFRAVAAWKKEVESLRKEISRKGGLTTASRQGIEERKIRGYIGAAVRWMNESNRA